MENNQSTPDHTEDKLDMVEDQSPYPSIREYNGMLHRFAMDILLKNSNAMIQGEFNPAITAIRNAYEIAGYVIGVGENYEFEEYNGIHSLRSNRRTNELKPEGKWKLNHSNMLYWIETDKGDRVDLKYLAWRNDDTAQYAAQRITDIYNEVMP